MAVARLLSSQKPGESESCLSVSTLYVRFSTSKKPPQDNYTVPHIFKLLYCHAAKVWGLCWNSIFWNNFKFTIIYMKQSVIIISILILITSCRTNRELSTYVLSDGVYKSDLFSQLKEKVYIENDEDTLSVYLLGKEDKTNPLQKQTFPQSLSKNALSDHSFTQTSFDVDFLTIPFKYRPTTNELPMQFNTSLNGAIFFGLRNDYYTLKYNQSPLNQYKRSTQHYGLSVGLFTGIGGTTMNSSVTRNAITTEYDGVVWSKGVAGIIGINNFTVGLSLGFDHLMDQNRQHWIYQNKPWLGLAFGLNIN